MIQRWEGEGTEGGGEYCRCPKQASLQLHTTRCCRGSFVTGTFRELDLGGLSIICSYARNWHGSGPRSLWHTLQCREEGCKYGISMEVGQPNGGRGEEEEESDWRDDIANGRRRREREEKKMRRCQEATTATFTATEDGRTDGADGRRRGVSVRRRHHHLFLQTEKRRKKRRRRRRTA